MCVLAAEVRRASAEEDASLPPEVLLPRPTHAYEVCSILPGIVIKIASMITLYT